MRGMNDLVNDFLHAAAQARYEQLRGERPKYVLVNPLGKFAELSGITIRGLRIATCAFVPGDAVVMLPARTFELKKEDA